MLPLIGAAVNIALAAVKIFSGWLGDSYVLIADGIESTADVVSSLIVWAGMRVADRPPNERYPYGYGKAETLAGLASALALFAAAGTIAWQSIRQIRTPHDLPQSWTLVVLVIVIVVKFAAAWWIGRAGKRVGSTALAGDAWHHGSDALTSAAALVGIGIALVGGPQYAAADDWAALVACVVIAYSGAKLLRLALRDMLDAAAPPEFEAEVRRLAAEVPGVRGIDKCLIRKSGTFYYVDIHVQVDAGSTVREGHHVGGRVRSALRSSALRIADVLVHIEPHEHSAV
ncbi:MAG: cation diffusion facilitator family transporter [Pirellulales bacterium]